MGFYDCADNQTGKMIGPFQAAAMTINGGIPGPVLRFTEGDTARIRVRSNMDVDTSVHRHGVLVPPGMMAMEQGADPVSLTAAWHSDFYRGAGLQMRF